MPQEKVRLKYFIIGSIITTSMVILIALFTNKERKSELVIAPLQESSNNSYPILKQSANSKNLN